MERQNPGNRTLCWFCANTSMHKCTWFNPDNPQPVPGWVATQTTVHSQRGEDSALIKTSLCSYIVHQCPNFESMYSSARMRYKKKPVKNLTTGVVYRSASEAAEAYGCNRSTIAQACRKDYKANGCRWAYVEDGVK